VRDTPLAVVVSSSDTLGVSGEIFDYSHRYKAIATIRTTSPYIGYASTPQMALCYASYASTGLLGCYFVGTGSSFWFTIRCLPLNVSGDVCSLWAFDNFYNGNPSPFYSLESTSFFGGLFHASQQTGGLGSPGSGWACLYYNGSSYTEIFSGFDTPDDPPLVDVNFDGAIEVQYPTLSLSTDGQSLGWFDSILNLLRLI